MTKLTDLQLRVLAHYEHVWRAPCVVRRWAIAPHPALPSASPVVVAEFEPGGVHSFWIYATAGMSVELWESHTPVELHMFSPIRWEGHIELLTVASHYHQTGRLLGVGHTVKFGRAWLPESRCDCALVSLPYLDGPALERMEYQGRLVRCLWLMPISEAERAFRHAQGLEALEHRFELSGVDYLDPSRESVVQGP